MAADVAQLERSNIKCYVLAFSNIQMEHKELSSKIITVKHKRLGIIFIFLVFFKFKKTNFKLQDKFKKKNDNDIATDMT